MVEIIFSWPSIFVDGFRTIFCLANLAQRILAFKADDLHYESNVPDLHSIFHFGLVLAIAAHPARSKNGHVRLLFK